MRRTEEISIDIINRQQIRHDLINIFLREEPGSGKKELCSYYNYFVEKLEDNKNIILKRPGRLNKGFDFEVHVEGTNFGTKIHRSRPTHQDIINDLTAKKAENPTEFLRTWEIIEKVYKCLPFEDTTLISLKFQHGYPIEMIIKTIKWLFIEQDMTYWNWSGRTMFYLALNGI